MTHKLPFILFCILIAFMTYRWWFGPRRDGRPGIRHITHFGVVFCMASLGFWFVTRFEDILAISSSPRETSIFATPWLWVSALCVGVTLLLVSFFTRVRHDHAVQQYAESLREQSSYFLVAESEGQIIASGGLSYWMRKDIAVLSFGLVRPSHQGKGIGTALLLARLALLNPKCFAYQVFIFAVDKSFDFYRRFGFRTFEAVPKIGQAKKFIIKATQ
jgi:N-acetylglutamate synthase-like GNAT family acetyltransferase